VLRVEGAGINVRCMGREENGEGGHTRILTFAPSCSSFLSAPAAVCSAPSSSPTLHPFFSGHAPPAIFATGSRRAGRASHPSNRVVDSDNAMNSASGMSSTRSRPVIAKQKAPVRDSPHRIAQKRVGDESGSDDEAPMPNRPSCGESTNVEETENGVNDQEYASLKAMADADHEVSAT